MIAIYDGGGAAPKFWCVELIPKLERLTLRDKERIAELAKGMPDDPDSALVWVAQVLGGFSDERAARFARDRRRLVVYRKKGDAAERARKETNEFWTAKVRPVRVV